MPPPEPLVRTTLARHNLHPGLRALSSLHITFTLITDTMLAGLTASLVLAATLLGGDARVVRRDAAPVTLPFVRRVNTTGVANILQRDQARAKMFKGRAASKSSSAFQQAASVFDAPATNQAVDYTTTVSIHCRLINTKLTMCGHLGYNWRK